MTLYVLNEEGEPVRESDFRKWAQWCGQNERALARAVVEGIRLHCVFVGVDERFNAEGPPLLWEVGVFHPDGLSRITRWGTRAEALQEFEDEVSNASET